jgi:hypothetical protein
VFLGGEIRVLVLIWDCSFGVIEEKKEEKQIREREREYLRPCGTGMCQGEK